MNKEELKWAFDAKEKILAKMPTVVNRNVDKIPYTMVDGRFDDQMKQNPCWWTNGFWGGMMWQLYNATGDDIYKNAALKNEEQLDLNLMTPNGMDHDSGFKWLPTSVANYRRLAGKELTDEEKVIRKKALDRSVLAATDMAGRFNPVGKYIRAWNDGYGFGEFTGEMAGTVIIDCMMNLPLLYWASETTKDPRFCQIARLHAETVIKNFIRPDGSSIHIGKFNPVTGEFLESDGGQGMGRGTSWTRGQSWALYGFTLSYLHTKSEEYLHVAERVADYFISNIPENGLIPVDFCQPKDITWEDSTAAAIAACGLIELSRVGTEVKKSGYLEAAIKLLKALVEKRCDFTTDTDAILEKCTAAYHRPEHEFAIIYGDYYLIEALWKLTGDELFIW